MKCLHCQMNTHSFIGWKSDVMQRLTVLLNSQIGLNFFNELIHYDFAKYEL